jgi:hypothetical protein
VNTKRHRNGGSIIKIAISGFSESISTTATPPWKEGVKGMKFTGICPISEETASIDIHPIYCGSNEHPGYYMKGRIVSCSVQGPKKACEGSCPIKQNAPDVFRLDQAPADSL